jgi:thiamine biosynthesis lipoprotein
MPTQEEIKEALLTTDIKAVELTADHRVRLVHDGVKVNMDSIGDGFAADEAAKILRAGGFADFLVDASGELYASGNNCKGQKWRIGIRDPNDTQKMIDIMDLSNLAVSTSGSYEQFYEIEGKRWPHIIDPRSGYPAEGIISATVVAPSSEFADFLSTAFCVLSPQESLEIIDHFGKDHAAMLVTNGREAQKKESSKEYHLFLSPAAVIDSPTGKSYN